jgi:hypothetical protein
MLVWLDEVVTYLCFAAIAFKYASSPCNNLKQDLETKGCLSNWNNTCLNWLWLKLHNLLPMHSKTLSHLQTYINMYMNVYITLKEKIKFVTLGEILFLIRMN